MNHLTIEGLNLNFDEKYIKKVYGKHSRENGYGSIDRLYSQIDRDYIAKKYVEEKTIKDIGLDWTLINNEGDRVLTFKGKMVYSLSDKDVERLNKI